MGVVLLKFGFFAKYGFSLVWQGAGWGGLWSPPLPGQDPFNLGALNLFPGFFGFSFLPPLPSSGSRAVDVVQDSPPSGAGLAGGRPSSFPKSAPMVGGGPLPKGRGGFAPYTRRGLLPFLRAKMNNRGKATPWPPTLLALRGEGVGGKPPGNNPEQVLNLGYFQAVAGFPTLREGCGPVTKIKNAAFLCEGRRKSLRRPSGYDPEFSCSFCGVPPWALILSFLEPAEAEAVVFYCSPGLVGRAEVNGDLIVVAVLCRCVSCSSCRVASGVRGGNGSCVGAGLCARRNNDVGSNGAVVLVIVLCGECVGSIEGLF